MSGLSTKILISWPTPLDLSVLEAAASDAEFSYCALTDPAILTAVADIEIWIAGGPPVQPALLDAAKRLKWLQMFGAGLPPGIFRPEFRDRGVIVSNAKGVNVDCLADHAIMLIMAFARGLPTLIRRYREWVLSDVITPKIFEVAGQTVGIVGYGAIGSAVAKRARGLGMTVWAIRRTPTEQDRTEVDRMMTPDHLPELLAAADHVVLSTPLTADTEGMIGEAQLALMKPSAHLYNIGRGKLVDQQALIDALNAGRIAGAGLDVTTPEPLPPDHPLWSMPNVLVTSHTAGMTPLFFPRVMDFIADNMSRYARGEMPVNGVDLTRGY
jgi:phosphoglycerate dehydrogenase-like enzyme